MTAKGIVKIHRNTMWSLLAMRLNRTSGQYPKFPFLLKEIGGIIITTNLKSCPSCSLACMCLSSSLLLAYSFTVYCLFPPTVPTLRDMPIVVSGISYSILGYIISIALYWMAQATCKVLFSLLNAIFCERFWQTKVSRSGWLAWSGNQVLCGTVERAGYV